MCNFLEYKDSKIVYRRYASLFFICGIGQNDNELIALEVIHRYVEILDRYFGNVCELDLIFNFQKAFSILDELIIAGELQESSKKNVLRNVSIRFLRLTLSYALHRYHRLTPSKTTKNLKIASLL